jgi:hypothetical protein
MLGVLPLQQSHRRIPLIQPSVVLPPPIIPVDLDGAITPAGVLLLVPGKALSGVLDPAGSLAAGSLAATAISGAVSPDGEITQLRFLQRLLIGFIEPRGPFTLTPLVTKFFRVAAEHYQRYRRLGGS